MVKLTFATRLARCSDVTLLAVSFLSAAVLRVIPEIVAWPNIIGYDVVAYYAPVLVHFDLAPSHLRLLLLAPNFSPLLYLLLTPFARILGEFNALRTCAVFIYGLLGAAVFIFTRRQLEWSPRAGLFASILTASYFVTLRIGLDLLKNVLGLVFLLIILAFMREGYESPRWRILIIILGILLAATHQVSALILLFVAFGLAAFNLLSGRKSVALRIATSVLPAAAVFAVLTLLGVGTESGFFSAQRVTVYFLSLNTQGSPTSPFVNYLAQYGSYSALAADVEQLFLFLYLPILPLAILGANRNRVVALLTLSLCLGSFSLLVSPQLAPLGWDRWMLMLTIPLSLYAAKGSVRLIRRIGGGTRRLFAACIILLMLGSLGVAFAIQSAEAPLGYFAPPELRPYFPPSMQASTVPLGDEQDAVALLDQLNFMMGRDSVLLVHESFYGWASITLTANTTIIDYHLGQPTDALPFARQLGFTRIYWIWWLPGYEWHNYRAPLNLFKPVLQSGHLAIFLYSPS
jgi:hypothetical protein